IATVLTIAPTPPAIASPPAIPLATRLFALARRFRLHGLRGGRARRHRLSPPPRRRGRHRPSPQGAPERPRPAPPTPRARPRPHPLGQCAPGAAAFLGHRGCALLVLLSLAPRPDLGVARQLLFDRLHLVEQLQIVEAAQFLR